MRANRILRTSIPKRPRRLRRQEPLLPIRAGYRSELDNLFVVVRTAEGVLLDRGRDERAPCVVVVRRVRRRRKWPRSLFSTMDSSFAMVRVMAYSLVTWGRAFALSGSGTLKPPNVTKSRPSTNPYFAMRSVIHAPNTRPTFRKACSSRASTVWSVRLHRCPRFGRCQLQLLTPARAAPPQSAVAAAVGPRQVRDVGGLCRTAAEGEEACPGKCLRVRRRADALGLWLSDTGPGRTRS